MVPEGIVIPPPILPAPALPAPVRVPERIAVGETIARGRQESALSEVVFSLQQIAAIQNRNRPQRRDINDVELERRPASRSITDQRGDNFVRIDSLTVNMPENASNMTQAELDRETSRQIGSIARAFRRDTKTRRKFRR